MEHAPLAELPVLTKRVLIENFDDLVTDQDVRRKETEAFLASGPGARLYRGGMWSCPRRGARAFGASFSSIGMNG